MGGGFAQLYRSIREQPWYKNSIVKAVFIELVLRANYETGKRTFKNVTRMVRGGQHLTSYQILADDLGITKKEVENALNLFKKLNQIEVQSFGVKGCLITISNYQKWQENTKNLGTIDGTNDGANDGTVKSIQHKGYSAIDGTILGTINGTILGTRSNKLNNIDINTPLTPQLAFDIFYELYPRKKSKDAAKKAFNKLCGKEPNIILKKCLSDFERKFQLDPNFASGGTYCPYPSTYLNQAQYEDEIAPQGVPNEITSQNNKQSYKRVRSAGTTQSAKEAIEAVNNHFGSESNSSFDMDQYGQDI